MKSKYQWYGLPVKVKHGFVTQRENTEKPMYWYNFECYNNQMIDGRFEPNHEPDPDGLKHAYIPAIEITQGNQTFVIANHCGIGVSKLLKGGWPNHAHFSLDGKFEEAWDWTAKITKFDLEAFEYHESERRKWQKATYPEEFAKMERLRESFKTLNIK